MDFFQTELMQTDRKLLARIVLREGDRFPKLAEFYHREVVAKILAFVTQAAMRAERDGRLRSGAYARYPQLIMAPMVFALVWDMQFGGFAPLDVPGLLGAHFEALFGAAARDTTS
jgi:hypothetical protein